MPEPLSFRHIELSGEAIIDGDTFDIFRFSVTYPVNGVPYGTVSVPFGYQAKTRTGFQTKATTDKIRRRAEIEVFITSNGQRIKAFRGYVASVSMLRSGTHAGLTLNIIHWLDDLQVSSALSADMTAAAMSSIDTLPVAFGLGSGADAGQSMGTLGLAGAIIESLKGENPDIAAALISALELFSSAQSEQGKKFVNQPAKDAIKLLAGNLITAFKAGSLIKGGITEELASAFRYIYSGQTLWQSLISLSGSFLFVVIPLVDKAFFVPFTPVMDGRKYKVNLTGDLFTYISVEEDFSQPLRGIQLYTNALALNEGALAGPIQLPVAKFLLSDVTSGMIDAVMTPRWLSTPVQLGLANSTYSKGQVNRTLATGKAKVDTKLPAQDPKAREAVGNLLAESLFYERTIGTSRATVRMPLTFNVGPGSLVKINAPVGEVGTDVVIDLLTYVSGVTISVDANTLDAHTDLVLTHLHGAGDTKAGPDGHPLYEQFMTQSSLAVDNILTD